MAEFFDISSWTYREWETTLKGTRPQNIVEDPINRDVYYFKQSKSGFPSEIWSEIIASKLGQQMGINTLNYNIALFDDKLGCLSKSMVNNNLSMLYHGVDVLNDFLPEFSIIDKPIVNFQQIENICSLERFNNFLDKFIEMIIFDAIIGNTDRHTENWAFIINVPMKLKEHKLKPKFDFWETIRHFIKTPLKPIKRSKLITNLAFESTGAKYDFSPIYDSGSCLAREKTEQEVQNLIRDKVRLNAYLNRGKHEIRWNNERLNFFELCKKIQGIYPNSIRKIVTKILSNTTKDNISQLVYKIDGNLVGKVENTYLSLERKELIITLIMIRLQRLKETLKID